MRQRFTMFANGIGGIARRGIHSDGEGRHQNVFRGGLKMATQRRFGNWSKVFLIRANRRQRAKMGEQSLLQRCNRSQLKDLMTFL
jgi:hypothetical protein